MGDRDPRFGYEGLHPGPGPLNRLDSVVDEVHLPAPRQFAENGIPNHRLVESEHLRANRQSARRRRLDHRQISHAGHGHLKCPGDRGRRERQHVHLGPELFEALLVADPEPLFLVDDDQSEVPELYVLLEEPVRPDDHIYGAGRKVLQESLVVLRALESREHPDPGGKGREALGKVIIVLLGQQGGRYEHGDLAIIFDRLEGHSHRDLCFTVSHISAHQPVHGLGGLHVTLDVVDGAELVRRLLILERRLEGMGHAAVGLIFVTMGEFPIGIEFRQLLRHLLNTLFDAGCGARPGGAPQPVQPGPVGLRPLVPLHLVQAFEGHVQLVFPHKFQDQVITLTSLD